MELVIASRNRKKAEELESYLRGLPVILRTLDDFSAAPIVEEDGETFIANAVKKALSAAAATGLCALADDSGLEVDALGGAPGVRSARFAGQGAGDEANNRLLLERLAGISPERRTARFRCVIALATPEGRAETVEGVVEGVIAEAPDGERGFGYDPLFYYPAAGRTFARMTPAEKQAVSHRGRALARIAVIIARRVAGGGP